MDSTQKRLALIAGVAFLIGWAVGLFLFGWGVTPVKYTGAGPQHLQQGDQTNYLVAMSDLYAFDNNSARVQSNFVNWTGADATICTLASQYQASDTAQAARLVNLAAALNRTGCPPPGAAGPTVPGAQEDGGGLGNTLVICGLLGLLVVLLAGIYLALQRRIRPAGGDTGYSPITYESGPGGFVASPEPGTAEAQVTPIARFQTTYARGHDTYDESFSIESAANDFLGECGVTLSESLGADMPKNVTAFEIWLFDKNDIRTVTKVVMSDHAFFDEAIKAKLAPKGEPVLARPNETIVLETASLIVNAEITDMEYGTGTLPPQSFFERFTVELSCWAKDGSMGASAGQGADQMLEF
jgi:hypothetical protein